MKKTEFAKRLCDAMTHAGYALRPVVWEEAENRLHAQKALMEYLLLGRLT